MKDVFFEDIKERLFYSSIPILFILLMIILFIEDSKADKKAWNNGFCECGGGIGRRLKVGIRNSTTYKFEGSFTTISCRVT